MMHVIANDDAFRVFFLNINVLKFSLLKNLIRGEN